MTPGGIKNIFWSNGGSMHKKEVERGDRRRSDINSVLMKF